MRLTRDQAQGVWQAFEDDPTLDFVELAIGDSQKLRVYRVEVIEKLRPVGVSRTKRKRQPVAS